MSARTDIDTDFSSLVKDLELNSAWANPVIIYCRSLNMCSDIYEYFHYSLGKKGYYPPGSDEICRNWYVSFKHF